MSLKDTFKQMKELLSNVTLDLEKSENGNKAASQRVRTGTVKLEKVAKLFRKESISSEKKNKGQKKPAKSASASKSKSVSHGSKAKAAAPKHKPAAHSAKSGAHAKKAAPAKAAGGKAKAKVAHTAVKSRPLAIKRATAKLPTKRR